MGAVEISEDVKSAISLLAYHIGVAATPAVARRRTISTIDAWLAELSAAERGRVIPALVEHLLSLHGVSSKRKTEF
jgi:predicted transcriptional regulator